MTKQQRKALEICSAIVVVIGVIAWYATPSDVVVVPALITLLGAAGAGYARLAERRENDQSVSELADRVRAESLRAEAEREADGPRA